MRLSNVSLPVANATINLCTLTLKNGNIALGTGQS